MKFKTESGGEIKAGGQRWKGRAEDEQYENEKQEIDGKSKVLW